MCRVSRRSKKRSMATSFTGKETTFGVHAKVDCSCIFSAPVMNILQGFLADREEFTLIVCCTRRFGKPAYLRRPQQVLFARAETLYIRFNFFVGLYGEAIFKVFVIADRFIIVLLSPFGIFCLFHQTSQYPVLYFSGLCIVKIYCF